MPANHNQEWRNEWKNMPEFIQEDKRSVRKIVVHFRNEEDVQAFARLINQTITPKQPSLWFPYKEPNVYSDKRYFDEPVSESIEPTKLTESIKPIKSTMSE